MAADIPVAEPTDVLHLLEPLLREILSAYCSVLLTGRAPGSHTAKWEWEKGEKRVAINSRACYTKSQTAQRDLGENFLSSGSLASMPGGKRNRGDSQTPEWSPGCGQGRFYRPNKDSNTTDFNIWGPVGDLTKHQAHKTILRAARQ